MNKKMKAGADWVSPALEFLPSLGWPVGISDALSITFHTKQADPDRENYAIHS
jgi:hypothetical protein